jgi:F420H(2)-dependent quinone reductase
MTAANPQIRPVARPLLQTFWTLHRAMYRLTGGRIGLQSPERGAKFGMLRLHTVGRRSGKARVTMVGYFEDGPNLVTLAMNGWGKAEPAWWLNLQADSTATVDLSNGKREVRARAANSSERERLWATFRDYPGWGSDIGALAAFRPGDTAIVVLEPTAETVTTGSASADVAGRPTGQGRRLRPQHLWIVPGLAIAIFANEVGKANGVWILALIAFGIAPDLPRLLGLGRRPVSSPPVQAFNLLHHPVAPIAAVAVATVATVATGLLPMIWLVGALVWLSHIVIGRGLGDVPRQQPRSDT